MIKFENLYWVSLNVPICTLRGVCTNNLLGILNKQYQRNNYKNYKL